LQATEVPTAAPSYDVALTDSRLYVAEGTFGIEAFDIEDLKSVYSIDVAQTTGEAISVEAHNSGIIVSEGEDGMETFNRHLDQLRHFQADAWPLRDVDNVQNVDVGPAHTIVSGFADGVMLMDFSDFESPSPTELINTGGRAMGAASTRSMAVLADALGGGGVVLFETEDGIARGISIPTEGRVRDVALRIDTVFMAEYGAGFGVATLADPELPVRLATFPSPGFVLGGGLLGTQTAAVLEYLEVGEGEEQARVRAFEIKKSFTGGFQGDEPVARPLTPRPIATAEARLEGEPGKMDIHGGLIAVACGSTGVTLLWTGCAL
jgi:hypothetical protein